VADRVSFLASLGRRLIPAAATVTLIAVTGCETTAPKPAVHPVTPPAPSEFVAPNQLSSDSPRFLRLPNINPDQVPVRIGIMLPTSSGSPGTRLLAGSMMKAAELALYDSSNRDIVLMAADDTGSPDDAAQAAQSLLDQGAEVIVGPLFAQSVAAVAPLARDRGVPVIAFSTDASVAGNGVYLLSFLPQSEVDRVVAFAAREGHSQFGAMIPDTPYGEVVEHAFRDSVAGANAKVSDVEHFNPGAGAIVDPAAALAKTNPDAILIAQGGSLLRGIAPTLSYDGLDLKKVKLLGTGLWDDPGISREALLVGGWFAAPDPEADAAFITKYKTAFGSSPYQSQISGLAYDAVSLVSLLASGTPYHRFTRTTLTDPNGFAGVDGIFRLNADGTAERGLAVLAVGANGRFDVVDPAPTTFQKPAS